MSGCPGQDRRYLRPGDVFEEPCPYCGYPIEFFKDDVALVCSECGKKVANPKHDLGCAAWCKNGQACLGKRQQAK